MPNLNPTSMKFLATSMMVFATLLLFATSGFSQDVSGSTQNRTPQAAVTGNDTVAAADTPTPAKVEPSKSNLNLFTKAVTPGFPSGPPALDPENWQLEIKPYVWLAGLYGTLRVNNTTAEVGQDSASVLGMLDFAAAAQVEAIKGNWRIMLDENYANLGTTGTGPLGLVTFDVQPTINIFEFGASYTFVRIANKNATASEPLPPIFTAEVLGGGRYFHLGLGLQANNNPPQEGSRNLVGPFVGNRFKVSPHKAVTLIGKYTVGGSGAGSNFAWSADALMDLRLKKGFSLGGGYRWLGMNADQPGNRIGFDGTMRGLMLTMTLYR
jgi:hypothetical protein